MYISFSHIYVFVLSLVHEPFPFNLKQTLMKNFNSPTIQENNFNASVTAKSYFQMTQISLQKNAHNSFLQFQFPHSPFPIPPYPYPLPLPPSPFQIPHSLFPISYFPFSITHLPFPIPHPLSPTLHSLPLILYSPFPLPIPHSPIPRCGKDKLEFPWCS